jgi:thiol-disulfide isomerase/thioredoxin
MRSLWCPLLLCLISFPTYGWAATTAGGAADSAGSTSKAPKAPGGVKRIKNLDYLDAATVRYYLSAPTADYDVAILFYAQWCKNCHALAPVWDQISRILKAGTTDSNVIVGLFDCEANTEHFELCTAARVKQYPTIAFFSMAGKNHHLSRSSPKHMTHYAANWQLGEAILDWIRTMSALSRYHRAGWGRWIQRIMFGGDKRGKTGGSTNPLPIGLPPSIANELELQKLSRKENETRALSVRTNTFVDALLFPVEKKWNVTGASGAAIPMRSDGGKNYTDVYAMLHRQKAWKSDNAMDEIIRTCVSEVSLDYCTRLSTNFMEVWIESWPVHKKITDEAFTSFQTQLTNDLLAHEPFCAIMDNCTLSNFAESKCQPIACPFTDPVVCRYLTACLTPQLQHEYAEALELYPHQQTTRQIKSKDTTKKPEKKGGGLNLKWGL